MQCPCTSNADITHVLSHACKHTRLLALHTPASYRWSLGGSAVTLAAMANAKYNSLAEYQRSQFVERPHNPQAWSWSHQKSNEPYQRQVKGKWWSVDILTTAVTERSIDHIGRIMETDLGKEVIGADRCESCIRAGLECFVYTTEGAAQIAKPGSACARCRVSAKGGGCSLASHGSSSKITRKRRAQSTPSMNPVS